MKLKVWLDKTPITVVQLSKTLNKSPATIYRWINGTRSPDKRSMKKLYEISKGQVDPNSIILDVQPSILKRWGMR